MKISYHTKPFNRNSRSQNLVFAACISLLAITCVILITGCKKSVDEQIAEEETPPVPPTGKTLTVDELNRISGLLAFQNAAKHDGKAPGGPKSGTLKISLKDTLYLIAGVQMPIRFLHPPTENIHGAYVQVTNSVGGNHASTYYDVQEVSELEDNDTVTVFGIGITMPGNTPGGVPPAGGVLNNFEITITTYNPFGVPTAQSTIPAVVTDLNSPGSSVSGECSLVTGFDDSWEWEVTIATNDPDVPSDDYFFYADPDKLFGQNGQLINGCCINGVSYYGPGCATRPLLFKTWYRREAELLTILEDGNYLRQTFESSSNPEPDSSDFCNATTGKVSIKSNKVQQKGRWTVTEQPVPQKLTHFYEKRELLTLKVGQSTGSGFNNPGGFIHQVNCERLVLAEPDREGAAPTSFKIYSRRNTTDPDWYPVQ